MKRPVALLIVLMICGALFAQTDDTPGAGILPLDKLGPDLSTLFGGVGDEVLANMSQMNLAGTTIGDAELGDFPKFYLNLLGVGATAFDGIGSVLRDEGTVWQFDALPLPTLVETALGIGDGSDGDAQKIYDATARIFALPTLSGGFGVGIARGFELLGSGYFLSDGMVTGLIGPFGVELPSAVNSLGFTLAKLHLNVRKTLITEGRFRPALSVALGFDHASASIQYGLESLNRLLDEPIELLGSTLDISGDLALSGASTGVGVDLQLSKQLLYVFVPFLKLSTWYHSSSYNIDAELTAAQYPEGSDEPTTQDDLELSAEGTLNDLSMYVTAGMELKLLVLVLHTSVGINLQGFSLAVGDALSGDFSNTDVNKVNVNIGLRIQI